MVSAFLREQKRYSRRELGSLLKCRDDELLIMIRKLKEYGVLKTVSAMDPEQKDMSDLSEEDVEVVDVSENTADYYYVFTFVGVITIAGRILKCYPKYLLNKPEPKKELKQVLKVLEKYNNKKQIIHMMNEGEEGQSFNLLAVILFLLDDYYENGIYKNTKEIIETNGEGKILWDRTINDTFTFISDNRPYYVELRTRKRTSNESDYFRRLHQCILTKISREMEEADLLDLFDITGVDLTDESLDEFGDKDYILYRLENELNIQFNTRKQMVLKTLYIYIAREGSMNSLATFSMIGSNSFNLVWEDVCREIFDDQLDKKLGSLELPIPLKPEYDRNIKLIDLIEKPLWNFTGKKADDTLIPDIVTISGDQFIIFDAKYYNAVLEQGRKPKGQPGIESITKQYLYQLAYQKFIMDQGFHSVINCFILPTEIDSVLDKGEVSMQMLHGLGLQNIKVRFLPATAAFEYYLQDKKMQCSKLKV